MAITDRNEAESAATRIMHAGSRLLFCHWEARRAESACPTRNDFRMSNLAGVLPSIAILENKPGFGWFFRLAGTQVCALFGKNLTGQTVLHDFEPFERQLIGRLLDVARDRLQPGLVRLRLFHSAQEFHFVEFLVLPVIDETAGKVQLIASYFVIGAQSHAVSSKLARMELVSARLIWTEHANPSDGYQPIHPPPNLRVIEGGLANKPGCSR